MTRRWFVKLLGLAGLATVAGVKQELQEPVTFNGSKLSPKDLQRLRQRLAKYGIPVRDLTVTYVPPVQAEEDMEVFGVVEYTTTEGKKSRLPVHLGPARGVLPHDPYTGFSIE